MIFQPVQCQHLTEQLVAGHRQKYGSLSADPQEVCCDLNTQDNHSFTLSDAEVLNSTYWKCFKFVIILNAFTTIKCTEAGSM